MEMSSMVAKRLNLTKIQARDGLPKISLRTTEHEHLCIREPRCNPNTYYRTIDGSCNNLKRPLWGRSRTPLIRLLPTDYADGISRMRMASSGRQLPPARQVSHMSAFDKSLPDRTFNLLVMQWGQFLDHDLTLSLSTTLDTEGAEGILCCPDNPTQDRRTVAPRHPACAPIPLGRDDPFYSRFRTTCMNFVRNANAPRPDCNLGPREQLNQLTHYLDGSMVYGSDNHHARDLRAFRNGLLKFSIVNKLEFLPQDDVGNRTDECAIPEELQRRRDRGRRLCFFGGDVRVNEQTGLTAMHNLFLRWHNFIARRLKRINPRWNDEKLFQETRRIVAAAIQHVTYNEWTVLMVGRQMMRTFGLFPNPSGFSDKYDENLNPNIINAFATAAYRLHTMIQGILNLRNRNNEVFTSLVLRNLFNNALTIYRPGHYDGYLRSLINDPIQTFDQFFTSEV